MSDSLEALRASIDTMNAEIVVLMLRAGKQPKRSAQSEAIVSVARLFEEAAEKAASVADGLAHVEFVEDFAA